MRRSPLTLACAAVLASLGTGCATTQARVVPVAPDVTLAAPAPPPRVIAQYAEAVPPVTGDREAAVPASAPSRPSPSPPASPAARPVPAPPVPAAAEPGLVLRPPGSDQKAHAAIRRLLAEAARDLGRVPYQTLGRDARVQHDTARRFMQQAEAALADGNLMFAGKLADKAASMAAVLVR
ncbi:MAG: hypothetical protein Q8L86_07580 [Vicinamibacterales bacterium]|nr:hypothetical protein [Vicinamibacterales bacterium]